MERTMAADPATPRATPVVDLRSSTAVTAGRLSWLLAALMAVQAGAGILAPAVYRDTGWVTSAWYGNDLVTLLVAVPLPAWALTAAGRGSLRAELVWYAMLGYAVYNYAYYLFGAALNALFPLYAALFVLPAFALILALGRIDVVAIAGRFSDAMPRRWIAAYMLFTGLGLTVAWTAQWAAYVFGGTIPSIGVEAFQLVAAMDLTFMVPWFIVGAILLLRRNAWGFVVAPIILLKGATYTLVLTTSSTVAALRGIEGTVEQIPIWAAWTAVGLLATWATLRSVRIPSR
ncbi:MAG TPA: hypothetical protein VLA59_00525 [Patescibacteria group bacterium]|nr:hypothetical protein [Patescibacteria group bacterium]